MKVLWITNILFPDVCKALSVSSPSIGGWMYSSAKLLVENFDIELAVAAITPKGDFNLLLIEGIKYYLLPFKHNPISYEVKLEKYWEQIENDFHPDVVHIHGTEFSHGLGYMKVGDINKVVISIQGLVSVYERYYYAGINFSEILRNITFRDIIRNDNLFQQKKSFQKRGTWEKDYILQAKYVIGRTKWDESHVLKINADIHYRFCNETLRPLFYQRKWNIETCVPYSIFLSQALYPIKGLHIVLKALPYILKYFPETKLYIAGENIFRNETMKDKVKFNGYAKYIKSLISKLNIKQYVVFLGMLDEQMMCKRYLNSHIFVCPSAIENSPNSLGEAQLLGVPCVASYVGGIPDMVEVYKSGLMYRFEEFEMLADCVCNIFSNNQLAVQLSEYAHRMAIKRHDKKECSNQIYTVYNEIMNNNVVEYE